MGSRFRLGVCSWSLGFEDRVKGLGFGARGLSLGLGFGVWESG